MEAEKILKNCEHDKHQERKRKGANLEAIFEHATKRSTVDTNGNNSKDALMNKHSENGTMTLTSPENTTRTTNLENAENSPGSSRNSLRNIGNPLGNPGSGLAESVNLVGNPRSPGKTRSPIANTVDPLGNARGPIGKTANPAGKSRSPLENTENSVGNRMEHSRNPLGIPRSPLSKANNSVENTSQSVSYLSDHETSRVSRERRDSERDSLDRETGHEGSRYTGFKQIQSSASDPRLVKEKTTKGSEFQNTITIKQEKNDDPPPVQIVPKQREIERAEKSSSEDNGEIGDDCLKFLLFSGKLYHCEKISDLTHSFSRFAGDSVLGRKGKVVVLLLFHKTLREVLNYVVGVVDHYTLEEHNIIIKIIKRHTYPTTVTPQKEAEKACKLVVGSKKLLYNLQPLHGSVYIELVKILDGFGANSAVDHAKISEFNAMVNANADRLDGQISNILGEVGYPFRGSFANRNFVPPTYSYLSSRGYPQNPRYSPLPNQLNSSARYSPEKSRGGTYVSSHERSKDTEIENVYQKRSSSALYREGHHVNTVSANQTVRITPRTANSSVEHIRATSAVPISLNARYRSALEDNGSLPSQRRNVEDLQTVAELCKEKMKRDMAEQELKSIKAAFEEFKAQMQQHLSQVEERMVLLEAENRTLKGKLSNIHQNNGFAEKKYHELRSQLEDLLKST